MLEPYEYPDPYIVSHILRIASKISSLRRDANYFAGTGRGGTGRDVRIQQST